jgi:hypothetical protein
VQSLPQPPQLLESVSTFLSQPSSLVGATGVVQLALSRLQNGVHRPFAHTSDAVPDRLQTRRQAPQFEMSLRTSDSQPSSMAPERGPLQSLKFVAQVWMQRPALQVREVLLIVEHGLAHAPQFATLVSVETSQPSSVLPGRGPLQSPKPPAQEWMHMPPEQERDALFVVLQGALQAPQLRTSVDGLTSQPFDAPPSQSTKPVLQA